MPRWRSAKAWASRFRRRWSTATACRSSRSAATASALHTPEGADRKAYTARTFSRPSTEFAKRMLDDPGSVGSRQYTRVLALGGGLPIKSGNEVVGVSGSPGKDDVCSQAGIDKVADQLK